MFGKTISSSFHEPKDIEDCYFEFDYHLLRSVFSSVSKKDYHGRGFDVNHIEKTIIGMGGVTADNLSAFDTLRFNGVGVLGGTNPLAFSWSHNPGNTGDVANQVPAGIYTAYVTDGNGCMDSVVIDLGQPDSLWGEFIIKNIDCYGQSTGGIITTNVNGAFGNYTFNLNLTGCGSNSSKQSNFCNRITARTNGMTLVDENGMKN